jgi:hypothetical protein
MGRTTSRRNPLLHTQMLLNELVDARYALRHSGLASLAIVSTTAPPVVPACFRREPAYLISRSLDSWMPHTLGDPRA